MPRLFVRIDAINPSRINMPPPRYQLTDAYDFTNNGNIVRKTATLKGKTAGERLRSAGGDGSSSLRDLAGSGNNA
jgi:hypothetical protein